MGTAKPQRLQCSAPGPARRAQVQTASHASSMKLLCMYARAYGIGPNGEVHDMVLRDHGIATAEEYRERVRLRVAAVAERDAVLVDPTISAAEKRAAQTRHTLEWGRAVVNCPVCWLRPYYCVCDRLRSAEAQARVVLHMHSFEWAKTSNTGCIVHRTLPGSEMLMCGHPDHDERFAELCAESDRTLAVLWPSDTSLSMGELKEIADRDTGGRITLIAVDATWNGARQVIRNHPPHLHRVQLDAEQIFPPGQERSMMAPLRSYSAADESYSNRACTLEAVAAALEQLEGSSAAADVLRENMLVKVNAVLRFNGKLKPDDFTSVERAPWSFDRRGQASVEDSA